MEIAPPTPPLRVLFFGHLPSLTGTAEHTWPHPSPPTVSQLLAELYEKWPVLAPQDASLRVAVNLAYTSRAAELPSGAEVAIMPPVQGG